MGSSFIYWGVCAQHLSTIGIANSGLQFIKNIYMYVVILASVHSFFVYIRVSTDQWGSSYSGHNNYNIDWEPLKVYPRQHSMKLNFCRLSSNWELKWAFLIGCCLSFVCPYVCNLFTFPILSRTSGPISAKVFTNKGFFFYSQIEDKDFFLLINVLVKS